MVDKAKYDLSVFDAPKTSAQVKPEIDLSVFDSVAKDSVAIPQEEPDNDPEIQQAEIEHEKIVSENTQPDKIKSPMEFQARNLINTLTGNLGSFLTVLHGESAAKMGETFMPYGNIPLDNKAKSDFIEGKTPAVKMSEVIDNWEELKQKNQLLLDEYDPNRMEEMTAMFLGIVADLPWFGFGGKIGVGALNYLGKTPLARKVLQKGARSLLAKNIIKGSTGAATALGTHATAMDALNQIAAGKSVEEVDLGQSIKQGGKSAILGAGVGAVGILSPFIERTAYSIKNPIGRWAAAKGIQTGALGVESAGFAAGGALLEGKDLTWEEFSKETVNNMAVFSALRLGKVEGFFKDPKNKMYDVFGAAMNLKKMDVRKEELDAAAEYFRKTDNTATIGSEADLMAMVYKSPEIMTSFLSDKNIPASLRTKVSQSIHPTAKSAEDLPNYAISMNKVDYEEKDGRYYIKTYDKNNELLEIAEFKSPAEAKEVQRDKYDYIDNRETFQLYDSLDAFSDPEVPVGTMKTKNIAQDAVSNVSARIRETFMDKSTGKSKFTDYDNFIANSELGVDYSKRSQEGQVAIDKVREIVKDEAKKFNEEKLKVELEEISLEVEKNKSEQKTVTNEIKKLEKLSKNENFSQEQKKKLTEKKSELSDLQKVEKSLTDKSLQKKETALKGKSTEIVNEQIETVTKKVQDGTDKSGINGADKQRNVGDVATEEVPQRTIMLGEKPEVKSEQGGAETSETGKKADEAEIKFQETPDFGVDKKVDTERRKQEEKRLSNKQLISSVGEINTGNIETADLPTGIIDKTIANNDKGNPIKVYINYDNLNEVLLSRNGKVLFRAMQGRFFIIAKVGDFYLPFYISSAGTSGKNAGEWYPFFGYNNWLVKGSVGKKGEMEYTQKVDEITKLLNENLQIPAKYFTQFGQITNGKGTPVNPDKVFYDINNDLAYESWFVEFDRKNSPYTEEQFVADRTGLNPKGVKNDGKGSADAWIRDVLALTENAPLASKGKINAKYDAELDALEQPIQSEIEVQKADIERRNTFTRKDLKTISEGTSLAKKGSEVIDTKKVESTLSIGDKITFFAEKERKGIWDGKAVRDEKDNPWGLIGILGSNDGWLRNDTKYDAELKALKQQDAEVSNQSKIEDVKREKQLVTFDRSESKSQERPDFGVEKYKLTEEEYLKDPEYATQGKLKVPLSHSFVVKEAAKAGKDIGDANWEKYPELKKYRKKERVKKPVKEVPAKVVEEAPKEEIKETYTPTDKAAKEIESVDKRIAEEEAKIEKAFTEFGKEKQRITERKVDVAHEAAESKAKTRDIAAAKDIYDAAKKEAKANIAKLSDSRLAIIKADKEGAALPKVEVKQEAPAKPVKEKPVTQKDVTKRVDAESEGVINTLVNAYDKVTKKQGELSNTGLSKGQRSAATREYNMANTKLDELLDAAGYKTTQEKVFAKTKIKELYDKKNAPTKAQIAAKEKHDKAVAELDNQIEKINNTIQQDKKELEAKERAEKERIAAKVKDIAEQVDASERSIREAYDIGREIFGFSEDVALNVAVVQDLLLTTMAIRAGVPKSELKISFEKGDLAKFQEINKKRNKGNVLFQMIPEHGAISAGAKVKLQFAKFLRKKGSTDAEIYKRTQWTLVPIQGQEGQWMYVSHPIPIDIKGLSAFQNLYDNGTQKFKLSDLIYGKFGAASEMGKKFDVDILFDEKAPSSYFDGEKIVLDFSPSELKKLEQFIKLTHEYQHKIQKDFGLGRGSSPSNIEYRHDITSLAQETIESVVRQLAREKNISTEEAQSEFNEFVKIERLRQDWNTASNELLKFELKHKKKAYEYADKRFREELDKYYERLKNLRDEEFREDLGLVEGNILANKLNAIFNEMMKFKNSFDSYSESLKNEYYVQKGYDKIKAEAENKKTQYKEVEKEFTDSYESLRQSIYEHFWGENNARDAARRTVEYFAERANVKGEAREEYFNEAGELIDYNAAIYSTRFQGDKKLRAAVTLMKDGSAIIHALENPIATSPLHEIVHIYEKYLRPEEMQTVLDWTGHKQWNAKTSERFAYGFERFLKEGQAPDNKLQGIFSNFKTWLTDIYDSLTKSDVNFKLNDKMLKLYGKMLDPKQTMRDKFKNETVVDIADGQLKFQAEVTDKLARAKIDKMIAEKQSEIDAEMKAYDESRVKADAEGVVLSIDGKQYKLKKAGDKFALSELKSVGSGGKKRYQPINDEVVLNRAIEEYEKLIPERLKLREIEKSIIENKYLEEIREDIADYISVRNQKNPESPIEFSKVVPDGFTGKAEAPPKTGKVIETPEGVVATVSKGDKTYLTNEEIIKAEQELLDLQDKINKLQGEKLSINMRIKKGTATQQEKDRLAVVENLINFNKQSKKKKQEEYRNRIDQATGLKEIADQIVVWKTRVKESVFGLREIYESVGKEIIEAIKKHRNKISSGQYLSLMNELRGVGWSNDKINNILVGKYRIFESGVRNKKGNIQPLPENLKSDIARKYDALRTIDEDKIRRDMAGRPEAEIREEIRQKLDGITYTDKGEKIVNPKVYTIKHLGGTYEASRTLSHLERVLFTGEYKFLEGKAKKIIKDIKKKSGTNNSIFGSETDKARKVAKIDAGRLTIDQLEDFIKEGTKILANPNPIIEELQYIADKYGDMAKIRKKNETFQDYDTIYDYAESIHGKMTMVDGNGNTVLRPLSATQWKDVMRQITIARRKMAEMLMDKIITPEKAAAIAEKIGTGIPDEYDKSIKIDELLLLGEVKGEYIEELEALRNVWEDSILEKKNSNEVKNGIESLPADLDILWAKRFVNVSKEDLKKLSITDLEAFDIALDNIRLGVLNPYDYVVWDKIEGHKNQERSVHIPTIQKMVNGKAWKLFNERIYLRRHNFWVKSRLNKIVDLVNPRGKDQVTYRKQNMDFFLQAHSMDKMDALAGNFDVFHQFSDLIYKLGMPLNQKDRYTHKVITEYFEDIAEFSKIGKDKKLGRKQRAELAAQMGDWVGMMMAELRLQEHPDWKEANDANKHTEEGVSKFENDYRFNPEKNRTDTDNKELFNRIQRHYLELFEYAKENGATRNVELADGSKIEILDARKVERLLMADKYAKALITGQKNLFAKMKPMARQATMMNKDSFIDTPEYFHYKSYRAAEGESKDVMSELKMGFNMRLKAGATFEATLRQNLLIVDPVKVALRYVDEITTNYYLRPALTQSKMALQIGMAKWAEATKGKDTSGIDVFLRGMQRFVTDRLAFQLETGRYKELEKGDAAFDIIERNTKKFMLSSPVRMMPEFAANKFKYVVTEKDYSLRGKSAERLAKYKTIWDGIIEDVVGSKYFTQYSQEFGTEPIMRKAKKTLEKQADWIITWADTKVGKPMFVGKFDDFFTRITGESFDPLKYESSTDYRVKYAQAIEQSSIAAIKSVENLFNSKNPLSSPMRASLLSEFYRPLKNKKITRLLDMLQSFNRNEFEQLYVSARIIRYSDDPAEVARAKRNFTSITISNLMYNMMRQYFGIIPMFLANIVFDNDEDEYIANKFKEFRTGKNLALKIGTTATNILIGGSGNIFKPATGFMLYILNDKKIVKDLGLTEESKEKLLEALEQNYYVSPIPKGGSTRNVLQKSIPFVPTVITRDVFDIADDLQGIAISVGDALKRGDLDGDGAMKMFHVSFIAARYTRANAWAEPVLRQWKREIMKNDSIKKKSKTNNNSGVLQELPE